MIRPRAHLEPVSRPGQSWGNRGDSLRLDMNELVPDIGEEVLEAIRSQIRPWMFSAYPEVNPLYAELAAYLGVKVENVVLTSGCDAGIRQAIETFCDPGDELLITYPTYGMYEVYAQIFHLRCSTVCYRPDFTVDTEELLARLDGNIKLLAIANPNGVLGSLMEEDDLERVLRKASERGTTVLLDEAYVEFSDADWGRRIDEFDNLVLSRTFSKAGGLAGLRVGYLLSNAAMRGWLYRAKPVVETNAMAILATRYLLAHPEKMTVAVAALKEGGAYLKRELESMGFTALLGHANFLLADFGAHRAEVMRALDERGIRVKDYGGEDFWARFTRITLGPQSSMEQVVEAVQACVPAGQYAAGGGPS